MRRIADYGVLQLPVDEQRVAGLMLPEHLTTARFEPVFREKLGYGSVDLVFERRDEVAVAHAVFVDMHALASIEGPVLLWPRMLPIGEDAAGALEDFVRPWLRTLVRGRSACVETIRAYRPSDAFAQARRRGLRGAAPFATTLPAASPFVYARRFAHGAAVRIACEDRYHAAATLAPVARSIEFAAPARPEDDLEYRWYGGPFVTDGSPASVAIVDRLSDREAASAPYAVALDAAGAERPIVVPEPVPFDHLFTFDPQDAPAARRFAVKAPDYAAARALRAPLTPPPAGGSGGTVAIVVREDGGFAADSDTESAHELARRLRLEGLTVETIAWNARADLGSADLVHVYGAAGSDHVEAAMGAARARGIPFVLSLDPLTAQKSSFDEDAIVAALRLGLDEEEQRMYRAAFYARKLHIDGVSRTHSETDAAARDSRFAAHAASATMILLECTGDVDEFLRRFPGIAPDRVVVRGVLLADESAAVEGTGEALPAQPFAFAHAPFVQRSNPLALLAAMQQSDVQIVIAGQFADVDLGITMRRVASPQTIVIPDPSAALVAALYRTARAYVDVSLRPAGASRLMRAALSGALPLVARDSPLAGLTDPEFRFDVMDPESVAGVVSDAVRMPDAARRCAQLAARLSPYADQRAAFGDVLAAYARAAAPDLVR